MDVGEFEYVDENVFDVEDVPDPDCEREFVPHDEALYESDAVPHALVVVDGDVVVEADVQMVALLELVTDDETDVENVEDTVDNVENVPDVV